MRDALQNRVLSPKIKGGGGGGPPKPTTSDSTTTGDGVKKPLHHRIAAMPDHDHIRQVLRGPLIGRFIEWSSNNRYFVAEERENWADDLIDVLMPVFDELQQDAFEAGRAAARAEVHHDAR